MTPTHLTEDDVRALLRQAVADAGSQQAWGREYGISQSEVRAVLAAKRTISLSVALALGLRRVSMYERVP